ncbi:MAG: protein-disulfide reductase DsbD [Sulfurimonas sp.]|nr:protein-disulfide reductase DsbD [Sulfurimonas sp.]
MKKIILLFLFITTLFAAPAKFLMLEEAVIPDVKVNEKSQIIAQVVLAKDIYLYSEQMKFEITSGLGISIGNIEKPEAIMYDDIMSYISTPTFIINLQKNSDVSGLKEIEFKMSYQACSKQGLCYEPTTDSFKLKIDSDKLNTIDKKSEVKVAKIKENVTQDIELSQTDKIAQTMKNNALWLILLTFFGFGLLLALTPCVFPMIPIISGVIVSQGKGLTTKKAFALSVVYVLAMSIAYTIAGVLAGLFGANIQAALQNPYIIYSFAGVFVALAMSMFGFYELKIPDSVVAKVSSTGKQNGYVGVAIMGFLSALIVGPCVAAPLAGALVYIGQTGDAFLGGMALFFMSIGMGLPLILVGVSAGKFMPRPGEWMRLVNAFFGVTMILVAIWMIGRIVDTHITMLLYSITGISFAFYLGLFDHEKVHHHVKKSIATIIFIYSVVLFIGVMGGSKSMTTPFKVFVYSGSASSIVAKETKPVEFLNVTTLTELDLLLEKHKGKKIILDFYADWCAACKELEEITFVDADVKLKMGEFILIKADITANTKAQKDLSAKYGVFGPPVILFIDENSQVIKSKTIVGFIKPKPFLQHLNKI